MQVGQDLAAQLRFGREHDLGGHSGPPPPIGIGGPLGGQIGAGAGQGMPSLGGEGAVHDVDGVRDPARAAHILPFDADRGASLPLLPGLVQDRHRVTIVQLLADEATDGRHRRHGVPLRALKQMLHLAGRGVARMLAEFADAWATKYPAIEKLWDNAWADMVPFLAFDIEIRKIIWSMNAIDLYRGTVRHEGLYRPLSGLDGVRYRD